MKKVTQYLLLALGIAATGYVVYLVFFSGPKTPQMLHEEEITWDVPVKKERKPLEPIRSTAPQPVKVEKPKTETLVVEQPVEEEAEELEVIKPQVPMPDVSVAADNATAAQALKEGTSALEAGNLDEAEKHLRDAAQSGNPKIKEEATGTLMMLSILTDKPDEAKKLLNDPALRPETISQSNSFNSVIAYHLTHGDEEGLSKYVDTVATKNPNLEPQVLSSLVQADRVAQGGDIVGARAMIDAAKLKAVNANNKELAEHAQNADAGLYLFEGQQKLMAGDAAGAEKLFDEAVANATGEAAEALKGIIDVMKISLQPGEEAK